MKKNLQQLEWLESEIRKDNVILEKEKSKLIENIKKLKKEDILPKPPEKLTLWQRIKKVLMG
jgi:uncharacterized protein YaaN involved in tellurite resistance